MMKHAAALVTLGLLLPALAAAQAAPDAAAIETWLKGYDAAFNARDLEKLATFYHPEVTIYEGGGINNGWLDYRDHHLGPELKAFENLHFGTIGAMNGSRGQRNRRYRTFRPGFVEDSPPATGQMTPTPRGARR